MIIIIKTYLKHIYNMKLKNRIIKHFYAQIFSCTNFLTKSNIVKTSFNMLSNNNNKIIK